MGRSLGAGKDLVALIRSELELVLSAIERQPSVHVGLEYTLAPDVRIVFGSKEALRQFKRRADRTHHKRDNNGVNLGFNSGVKSVTSAPTPPSLSGIAERTSGSGSESLLPDSNPENLSDNARVADASGVVKRPAKRAARAAKPRSAKWTRVPAEWEPNDEHRRIARDNSVTIAVELANFRDWEFRTPRSDPDAVFRTWLRRAGADRQRMGGYQRPPGQTEHEDRAAQEAARRPERRVYRAESEPKQIDLQATLAGVSQARQAMRKQ